MKTTSVYFANDAKQAVVTPALWQWDYGQQIIVHGLNLPASYTVHIGFTGNETLEVYQCRNNAITIPDRYLETGNEILIFICLADDSTENTSYLIRCPVRKRAKPTNEE